mmetsp:Transcript_40191/g.126480  ORF Transcript_40191/g.126480 Transcript_40191/m.126480 type:complete len:202 (+) Transcript_40191:1824-2429(+)
MVKQMAPHAQRSAEQVRLLRAHAVEILPELLPKLLHFRSLSDNIPAAQDQVVVAVLRGVELFLQCLGDAFPEPAKGAYHPLIEQALRSLGDCSLDRQPYIFQMLLPHAPCKQARSTDRNNFHLLLRVPNILSGLQEEVVHALDDVHGRFLRHPFKSVRIRSGRSGCTQLPFWLFLFRSTGMKEMRNIMQRKIGNASPPIRA